MPRVKFHVATAFFYVDSFVVILICLVLQWGGVQLIITKKSPDKLSYIDIKV